MYPSFRGKGRYLLLGFAATVTIYCLFPSSSSSSSWRLFQPALESVVLERYMNWGHASEPMAASKSSFDWSSVKFKYPPIGHTSLPTGDQRLPKVQAEHWKESGVAAQHRKERRKEVKRLFQKNWASYRRYAWKKDALLPLTAGFKDQFSGWAATLIDSLDTIWIMGLKEEFEEAVAAVAEIDFGQSTSDRVNTFETNIRYLGGLLGAYDLSKRKILLAKAIEIGDFLYAGFNTPNRMPVDFIDFEGAKTGEGLEVEGGVVSASPGTVSLELTRLSQVTGDTKYYHAAKKVMELFHRDQEKTLLPGMWPVWISMKNEDVISGDSFTIGGGADSLYEYLPKMVALLNGKEPMFESMTRRFLDAADRHLFFRPMVPGGEDILISGNAKVDENGTAALDPESEHLSCFIGGTFVLAGKILDDRRHVDTGRRLTDGCVYAYRAFPTGIMPERYNMVPCEPRRAETCRWSEDRWKEGRRLRPEWKEHLPRGFTTAKDPRYLLRPEAIESVFVAYRVTGDSRYQRDGWEMFKAIRNGTSTRYANAAVRDVTVVPESGVLPKEDYMESFWLAETLKYFYLLFSPPDLISLDEFVLNTEAHPFRRAK